jgi:hypothetical protein
MIAKRRMTRRIAAALASFALLTAAIGIIRLRAHAETPLFADIHIDVELLRTSACLDSDFALDFTREAEYITGPTILGAALKQPAVARLELVKGHGVQAPDRLSRQIRVEVPATDILRIRYAGKPSPDAARLVNTIAAVYVEEMVEETRRARADRIALLERAVRDTTRRLTEKREAIRRLEELLSPEHDVPGAFAGCPPERVALWTRELETQRVAVIEGDKMLARFAAELAQLRIEPTRAAVELYRPATCSPVTP